MEIDMSLSWWMHLLTPLPAQGILYSPSACSQEVCVQGHTEGWEPRHAFPRALSVNSLLFLTTGCDRWSHHPHVIHKVTEVWRVRRLLPSTRTLQAGSTWAHKDTRGPAFLRVLSLSCLVAPGHSRSMWQNHTLSTPVVTVPREGKSCWTQGAEVVRVQDPNLCAFFVQSS